LSLETFSRYSYFTGEYLGRMFRCPIYPWEALEPYWFEIAMGISKTLLYGKYTSNCYKDHKLWIKNRQGLEALRFADALSRDRGFRWAVKLFNKQAPSLKYGEWLAPIEGDTPFFWQQLTQLGQLIYNSMRFLINTEYIRIHKLDLGVEVLRPYWAPTKEHVLLKEWGYRTCLFIRGYYDRTRKYPSLREIAGYWDVPRYVLVDAGFTRDTVYSMYRNWRKTGRIKIIKVPKTYTTLSEEEQRKVALEIAKRVTLD